MEWNSAEWKISKVIKFIKKIIEILSTPFNTPQNNSKSLSLQPALVINPTLLHLDAFGRQET
jgi:hypothetical protein